MTISIDSTQPESSPYIGMAYHPIFSFTSAAPEQPLTVEPQWHSPPPFADYDRLQGAPFVAPGGPMLTPYSAFSVRAQPRTS